MKFKFNAITSNENEGILSQFINSNIEGTFALHRLQLNTVQKVEGVNAILFLKERVGNVDYSNPFIQMETNTKAVNAALQPLDKLIGRCELMMAEDRARIEDAQERKEAFLDVGLYDILNDDELMEAAELFMKHANHLSDAIKASGVDRLRLSKQWEIIMDGRADSNALWEAMQS